MGCIFTHVCAADEDDDELLTEKQCPTSSSSTSSTTSLNVFPMPRFSRTATTIFTLDPVDLQPTSTFPIPPPRTANHIYYGGGIPGIALDEATVESSEYTGAIPEGYTSIHHHVRWGVHTRAGTDPMQRRKENQDAYCIVDGVANEPHVVWFSVFDGHGPNGAFSSHFVREKYQESLATAYRQDILESQRLDPASIGNLVLPNAAQSVMEQLNQSSFDISVSGTTAVGLLVIDQDVFVSNIGDSRAILAVFNEPEAIYSIVHETKDHKPELPEEQARIEAHNGRVFEWGTYRVWLADKDMPGLAMSRSFGDSVAHTVGVTSEPDVTYIDQLVHHHPVHPSLAILASDGVWEFMSSEEVLSFVSECILVSHLSPQETCNALVQEATERWKDEDDVIDDITAIVVYF